MSLAKTAVFCWKMSSGLATGFHHLSLVLNNVRSVVRSAFTGSLGVVSGPVAIT